jgi:hypothetical protein
MPSAYPTSKPRLHSGSSLHLLTVCLAWANTIQVCAALVTHACVEPSRPAASMGTILSSVMVIPFGGALSRL